MFLTRRREDVWGGWPSKRLARSLRRHVTDVGRIEEAPAPQLERQHRPELEIEVAAARVQLEQALDGSGVEDAPVAAGPRQQHVARKPRRLAAEPVRHRHLEAMLPAVVSRVG